MDENSKFMVFPNPMGILNQKNLWPTSIYQFEHTGPVSAALKNPSKELKICFGCRLIPRKT